MNAWETAQVGVALFHLQEAANALETLLNPAYSGVAPTPSKDKNAA